MSTAAPAGGDEARRAGLQALLSPRSIVLVGVSPDAERIRGRMLESILASGFDGPLHLVSRSHRRIRGLPCIGSPEELPPGVDLAIIAVPNAYVCDAMEACAGRGVRAAVIISSGFAEEGSDAGRAREQRLRGIITRHGMQVLGPNGEGYLNAFAGLAATFSPVIRSLAAMGLPHNVRADAVAITSQSGGIGFAFLDRGQPRRLPFGYVVSMGNEAGCESLDVMDHLLDDARVGVGLMFVEGLRTPAKLAPMARKAMALGKPLVVAKMGRSEPAAAAAAAHTSSLAGTWRAHRAMFDHLGMAVAQDLDEALDLAAAFAFHRHRLPAGRRVAVITPSGGAGIWLTEACAAAGLEVPALDADTRAAFDALLPPYGSSRNPVDVTAQFIFSRGYASAIEIAARSPAVDAIMVASSLTRSSAVEHEYEQLVAAVQGCDKPVTFWSYTLPHPDCVALLAAAGIPCYTGLTGAARGMAALADYRAARERAATARATVPAQAAPAAAWPFPADRGVLCEHELSALLAAYGVTCRGALATSPDAAVHHAAAARGPVAVKVQSPDLPHKSDAGALALDVSGEAAVREAFARVLAAARNHAPDADVHGVLVQPMAPPGVEMILGLDRDPGFGLLMLVGAGGVLVELTGDSVLAPPPASREEALHMLDALHTRRLLAGVRGAPAADVDALVALMLGIARLAADHGEWIQALDLNPVIVHPAGQGVSVVDALLYARAPSDG
jgi:acyl-CoA synthetase (NDP forming)